MQFIKYSFCLLFFDKEKVNYFIENDAVAYEKEAYEAIFGDYGEENKNRFTF